MNVKHDVRVKFNELAMRSVAKDAEGTEQPRNHKHMLSGSSWLV